MAQTIAIIDYGSGNLRSVEKAFEVAADAGPASRIVVTDAPCVIADADRVVLPGVGAFAACMDGLVARGGVLGALKQAVVGEQKPFLGICVGMQLLATQGLEYGPHNGLGWIAGKVVSLASKPGLRIPHMGWNDVRLSRPHPLFSGLSEEVFYFAHSYHFDIENDNEKIAVTGYGGDVVAGVARGNIAGVQFHPEKSQRAGLKLISNFLKWRPDDQDL